MVVVPFIFHLVSALLFFLFLTINIDRQRVYFYQLIFFSLLLGFHSLMYIYLKLELYHRYAGALSLLLPREGP